MVEDLLKELAREARQYFDKLFNEEWDSCSYACRQCITSVLTYYNLKIYFIRKIEKNKIISKIEECKAKR
ncbi:MAG: hypothetical protein F7C34_02190 [Desulfurococcales archaeon]|nr:hypothetical protein [Desulfurococcales archaeon]